MKKILFVFLGAALLLTSCANPAGSTSSSKHQTVAHSALPRAPMLFGGGPTHSSSRSLARDIVAPTTTVINQGSSNTDTNQNQVYGLLNAPLLGGWTSTGVQNGDTLTYSILGATATVSVAIDVNGAITYTGIFPDGISGFTLVINGTSMTYSQKLVVSQYYAYDSFHYTNVTYASTSLTGTIDVATGQYDATGSEIRFLNSQTANPVSAVQLPFYQTVEAKLRTTMQSIGVQQVDADGNPVVDENNNPVMVTVPITSWFGTLCTIYQGNGLQIHTVGYTLDETPAGLANYDALGLQTFTDAGSVIVQYVNYTNNGTNWNQTSLPSADPMIAWNSVP